MFYTALIIGFMGSLHCVGMCSPLAMAVANLSPRTMISRLLYNSGRILTYSILGATVASVGFALPLTHYQNVMSLVLVCTAISGFTSVAYEKPTAIGY